jgi:restriction system protein
MKLSLPKNSLYAILLRSPWWASVLAALVFGALVRFILPTVYAVFAMLPFFGIAAYAAWRQFSGPSATRVAGILEHLRTLSSESFLAAIEEAYRREGYEVKRLDTAHADLELAKDSRTTLLACKRWKATRTGIEPLRGLHAAARARDAQCIYVAAGEVTETAREFAAKQSIRLVQGADLAQLLVRIAR